MNHYGNKVGYHTPERSAELFKIINKGVKGARFEDSSWHNDLTDSVVNMKRDIHIMLPNSEFNTFAVNVNDLVFFDTKEPIRKSFLTTEEVIIFIQEYVNKFDKL